MGHGGDPNADGTAQNANALQNSAAVVGHLLGLYVSSVLVFSYSTTPYRNHTQPPLFLHASSGWKATQSNLPFRLAYGCVLGAGCLSFYLLARVVPGLLSWPGRSLVTALKGTKTG